MADIAGSKNASASYSTTLRQRAAGRTLSRTASACDNASLSGPRIFSATRVGNASARRWRCADRLRSRWRSRCRYRVNEFGPRLCTRRKPRIGGNAYHTSGVDDTLGRSARTAGRFRHHRRPRSSFGRFGKPGRSDRRSRSGSAGQKCKGGGKIMTRSTITILKFGGSVLKDENDLPKAVHEIYRHWRRGAQVVAVVSAFGGSTDALIERSKAFGRDLHPEAFASLLFTGEATSAALLALALDRAGVPTKLLSPDQVGLSTTGNALDAAPTSVNAERLRAELDHSVVIVSGFAGVNDKVDLTLLGRGGTDYTALFLAQRLNGRCVLLKDVDGLYESNPSNSILRPRRFARASYQTTARLAGKLVQAKAVRFAEQYDQPFEIGAIGGDRTLVGDHPDELAPRQLPVKAPVRVALLGCGTVGGGVYQRLAALPELFQIVGVVNINPDKALATGIDPEHIERDALRLIARDCDVVIELIGGVEPARTYVEHAIKLGRHVVTANKALLAEAGHHFRACAN